MGVEDFDSVKNDVLENLAKNIFVKESKFRYLVEQRHRLSKTNYIFNRINLNDKSIEYFVVAYNLLIRIDVDRSNLWRSPKIRGEKSFLEKYDLEAEKEVEGIQDLKRDIKENGNFVNSLMAKLHSF